MKLSQLLSRYDHDQHVEIRNDDGVIYKGLCQDTPLQLAMHRNVQSFRAVAAVGCIAAPYIVVRVN